MNFLAHLYLSGSNAEIRLGNFIGDHVKGKRFDQYPPNVRKGIQLHRAIDTLTDQHPSTKTCKEIIKPGFGRYSGVVTDVLFDHILAIEWSVYSQRSLKNYTRTFYLQMLQRYHLLPPSVRRFLPFMIQSNRLYTYSTEDGIRRALDIMGNYTSLPSNSEYAVQQLADHKEVFKSNFHALFTDLISLSKENSIEVG
ncbi:MAG: DUF479 domain-containing protein [Bacteroidales bacterium]|nr:DUF479 domain-containing protein [Bacteroidales bacterium]